MPDWAVVALVGLGIPLYWYGLLYLIGRLGPWHALVERFPFEDVRGATPYRFVSLEVRWASYGKCVFAEATADRLTLSVILPFRPGHPPFTLPRSAVSDVKFSEFWGFRSVSFFVDGRKLKLSGGVVAAEFWQ